ncbi:hypothetical protein HJC23_005786 [Cyclotella cryptica]|uniref:Uncharacterized protein n=1 Tax=Cyclotella cryptica TaxID=29204 RepID=A0ABD3P9P1_9STRA|eukprot:CCRYP_016753-RB/>CCRYP_016753-RB protein AED:0.08 eAED:0.08 QI:713/1/1/1/0.66/0.5/4/153/1075
MLDQHRYLEGTDDATEAPPPKWEAVYTIIVLVLTFATLILDRVGTDSVMLTALTALYLAQIIDIKEALAGFSSSGLLTVLVLFVVAEGLNKTGALNWYVGKLFGRPSTPAGAQIRVMAPIMALSGFINDTPLVTIALPVLIQWAGRVKVPLRLILIPLSFAALLGGVFTIIGTSTNLIVVGLLLDAYPNEERYTNLSLFALTPYGVPVGFIGMAYVILMSPLLLMRKDQGVIASSSEDDILLGARLTQWSPAAGRSIKRSGLRDTGGIYLVSVMRKATGNVHTAVSPDFVLEVDDILYFTGLIDSFGEFCEEHGLEVITNEIESSMDQSSDVFVDNRQPSLVKTFSASHDQEDTDINTPLNSPARRSSPVPHLSSPTSAQQIAQKKLSSLGFTLDSLLGSTVQDRMRIIFNMQDAIRGDWQAYAPLCDFPSSGENARVVVSNQEDHDLVVVAIDTLDRPGLLLDISKCLSRLHLELHHTEAAVRHSRSLSIWRCEASSGMDESLAEIWSVIQSLVSTSGAEALRQRGLQVLRARVRDGGLVGKTIGDIPDFREKYKAAIVAIQKADGAVYSQSLSKVMLDAGDLLVLQVNDDSPLREPPPEDFYTDSSTKRSSYSAPPDDSNAIDADIEIAKERNASILNDLEVLKPRSDGSEAQREFLTAMKVEKSSRLSGKTVAQSGIDKLPGLFLVSIDRPHTVPDSLPPMESYTTIPLTDELSEGDLLWFSGSATSVGNLRKIPGLSLLESDEVMKMGEKAQDRRLVEAVVSRNGPLVGKTVKELKFRSTYGAAVIAVHREGRRVHELPGNIKLQAGDVLLLEAGKSFLVANKNRYDTGFTLVAEVENSSPPRFRMLIPAVILTVGAYVCYMLKLSSLFGTAMTAAILMVACGVLSEAEARSAIQWQIYLTIAPAFGVGQALINSGVAAAIASFLVKVGTAMGIGSAGLLGAVYLATVLMSQVVANNAAAALIFPIAMDAAARGGIDPLLMAFSIMLAASAAFMTPFGYQTNLMVMGHGGYSTGDFLIFGTPMQIVLLFVSTVALVVPAWWLVWLISFAVLVLVCVFRVLQDRKKIRSKST